MTKVNLFNLMYLLCYNLSEDDGSETTVSRTKASDASSDCLSTCKSASASNTYYGLQRISATSFKCKCLDQSFSDIIVSVCILKLKYFPAFFGMARLITLRWEPYESSNSPPLLTLSEIRNSIEPMTRQCTITAMAWRDEG